MPNERTTGQEVAHTSMREVKRVARHRVLALVDQAFEGMDIERTSGKRDAVASLIDAYHRDPLTWLERVRVLSADNADNPHSKGTKSLGLQALFVSAAREFAASPSGVQVGLVDMQAIEHTNDIEW